jgi:hypothetical protein
MDLEQESRESSDGAQLNSEVVCKIMCLYASVPKIDAFERLGIVQQNSDDNRFWVDIQSDLTRGKLRFRLKNGSFLTEE